MEEMEEKSEENGVKMEGKMGKIEKMGEKMGRMGRK